MRTKERDERDREREREKTEEAERERETERREFGKWHISNTKSIERLSH